MSWLRQPGTHAEACLHWAKRGGLLLYIAFLGTCAPLLCKSGPLQHASPQKCWWCSRAGCQAPAGTHAAWVPKPLQPSVLLACCRAAPMHNEPQCQACLHTLPGQPVSSHPACCSPGAMCHARQPRGGGSVCCKGSPAAAGSWAPTGAACAGGGHSGAAAGRQAFLVRRRAHQGKCFPQQFLVQELEAVAGGGRMLGNSWRWIGCPGARAAISN